MANIFEVLPNDLIGEILSHINHVELLYFSQVCKYWQATCYELIWKYYDKSILQITNNPKQSFNNLDEFLNSKQGRKFIKYLLRKQVYDFACRLARLEVVSEGNIKTMSAKAKWVDTELSILKGFFQRFSDLNEQPPQLMPITPQVKVENQPPKKGFFSGALSFIGSMFSNNPSSSGQSTSSPQPVTTQPKSQDYDFLTKVVLDGDYSSGKTSLLNCAMNEIPVNTPNYHITTIGVDFAMKNFQFGDTTKVKLQLWDQCGPERFRQVTLAFYRGASVILALVDPYSEYAYRSLESKVDIFKKNAPKAEIVIITTKKDLDKKREISNEQADKFAFDNFGTIHLDITNTNIQEPKNIIWYSALLKYLLSP